MENLSIIALNALADLHKKVFGSTEKELPQGFEACRLLSGNDRNTFLGVVCLQAVDPTYARFMLRENLTFRFRVKSDEIDGITFNSCHSISHEGLRWLAGQIFVDGQADSQDKTWHDCFNELEKQILLCSAFLVRLEVTHFAEKEIVLRGLDWANTLLNPSESDKKEIDDGLKFMEKRTADWARRDISDYPPEKRQDAFFTKLAVRQFLKGCPVGNFDSVEAIIRG